MLLEFLTDSILELARADGFVPGLALGAIAVTPLIAIAHSRGKRVALREIIENVENSARLSAETIAKTWPGS